MLNISQYEESINKSLPEHQIAVQGDLVSWEDFDIISELNREKCLPGTEIALAGDFSSGRLFSYNPEIFQNHRFNQNFSDRGWFMEKISIEWKNHGKCENFHSTRIFRTEEGSFEKN